jgi:uncharacterized protein (TIGR00159 family)
MLVIAIGFLEFTFVDFLDILAVTTLLYQLYKLIKGSVAVNVFFGFLFFYLIFLLVRAIGMPLLSAFLGQFIAVGVLALLVVFQPEIRKFLLVLGRTTDYNNLNIYNLFKFRRQDSEQSEDNALVSSIAKSVSIMSENYTGALIVISLNDPLTQIVARGDEIDAKPSSRLIHSIFFKNSPLHDGAMVIHRGRILAARCILPVSEDESIPASLGLRHRAAAGISEAADVAVVVVSEETGSISYVRKGLIFRNQTPQKIRFLVAEYLSGKSAHQADSDS